MGTRYGPIEYREKDHYDIDQKLLSVDHCESMSYFGDFNHIEETYIYDTLTVYGYSSNTVYTVYSI